ncbi:hypothetical protein CEXT_72131 [Caerostris extrusa]|uniref:Uncharacterized protein n=1 Tax=Caerostris extrusa TaxID=172846 RepID=A0AAV4VBV7_CAEEX|nr:hypothetical protein CEXT_72131 [Caerostris extrusa]
MTPYANMFSKDDVSEKDIEADLIESEETNTLNPRMELEHIEPSNTFSRTSIPDRKISVKLKDAKTLSDDQHSNLHSSRSSHTIPGIENQSLAKDFIDSNTRTAPAEKYGDLDKLIRSSYYSWKEPIDASDNEINRIFDGIHETLQAISGDQNVSTATPNGCFDASTATYNGLQKNISKRSSDNFQLKNSKQQTVLKRKPNQNRQKSTTLPEMNIAVAKKTTIGNQRKTNSHRESLLLRVPLENSKVNSSRFKLRQKMC